MQSPNTWKVTFNERRVERAVRSIYEEVTLSVEMIGDDGQHYPRDSGPLFIVADIDYIVCKHNS